MEDGDESLQQPGPQCPACSSACSWRMRPPGGRFDMAGFVAAGVLRSLNDTIRTVVPAYGRIGEYAMDIAAMMRATQAVLAEAADLAEARSAIAAKARRIDLDFVLADLATAREDGCAGLQRLFVTAGQLRVLAEAETGDDEQRVDVNEVLGGTLGILAAAFAGTTIAGREFASLPPLRCRAAEVAALLRSLLRLAFAAAGDGGAVGVATAVAANDIRIEISWRGAAGTRALRRPPEYCLACAIVGEHGGELATVAGDDGSGAFHVRLPARRSPIHGTPPAEAGGDGR